MLKDLVTNLVLVIPGCTWGIAQLLKLLIALFRGKGFDPGYLVSSGGMPSAHSAVVSSMATTIAITAGFGSTTFAIAVIMALIVMYDSAGVRQSVSQQSVVLNRIVSELKFRQPRIKIETDLRELVGHTPFQVIVGAALGIAVTWLWLFIAGY